jgi:hypothetical protein
MGHRARAAFVAISLGFFCDDSHETVLFASFVSKDDH